MADQWPDAAAIEAAVQLSITTELRVEDALRYLGEGWSGAQIRSAYDEAQRRGCALCEVLMGRRKLRGPCRVQGAGGSERRPNTRAPAAVQSRACNAPISDERLEKSIRTLVRC